MGVQYLLDTQKHHKTFMSSLLTSRQKIINNCLKFLVNRIIIELQWNLSKADTYGTEVFVRFREVSALESFELKSSQI